MLLTTFKQLLSIDTTDTTQDNILSQILLTATDIIEEYINFPLSEKTFIDTFYGKSTKSIVTKTYPITSLTSALENTTDITSQLTIRDELIGLLYYDNSLFSINNKYTIVYLAGYSAIPSGLEYASRLLALKSYSQITRIKDGVIRLQTQDGTITYDNTLLSPALISILSRYRHISL